VLICSINKTTWWWHVQMSKSKSIKNVQKYCLLFTIINTRRYKTVFIYRVPNVGALCRDKTRHSSCMWMLYWTIQQRYMMITRIFPLVNAIQHNTTKIWWASTSYFSGELHAPLHSSGKCKVNIVESGVNHHNPNPLILEKTPGIH
jgi:hypothetical protein